MANSINEIVAHIGRNFFAKPNRYKVQILGNYGSTKVGDVSEDVMFNCAQVNIPGLNIGLNQHRKHGIGVPTFVPSGKTFTECTMSFYESEAMLERSFFSNWVASVMKTSDGRLSYFNDIKKDIIITQYDTKNNITYTCTLRECFPSNISPSDRSYSAENTVSQFVVSLQFRSMEEVFGKR